MRVPVLPVRTTLDATLNFEALQTAVTVGRGTLLPTNPLDGEVYDYVADSTNGVIWRLRYRAESTSTHKWEFVGGAPLLTQKEASNSAAGTANIWAVIGSPTVAIPLSGDYEIGVSTMVGSPGAVTSVLFVGPAVTGSTPFWAAGANKQAVANTYVYLSTQVTRAGLVGGNTLEQQYQSSVTETIEAARRTIWLRPIRVG